VKDRLDIEAKRECGTELECLHVLTITPKGD